jgi:hypothetical protein
MALASMILAFSAASFISSRANGIFIRSQGEAGEGKTRQAHSLHKLFSDGNMLHIRSISRECSSVMCFAESFPKIDRAVIFLRFGHVLVKNA